MSVLKSEVAYRFTKSGGRKPPVPPVTVKIDVSLLQQQHEENNCKTLVGHSLPCVYEWTRRPFEALYSLQNGARRLNVFPLVADSSKWTESILDSLVNQPLHSDLRVTNFGASHLQRTTQCLYFPPP